MNKIAFYPLYSVNPKILKLRKLRYIFYRIICNKIVKKDTITIGN